MSETNKPAERSEQHRQILQQEEKAGVNKSNVEGRVDSTRPPGSQGGEYEEGHASDAPREQGRKSSGPAGLSGRAPASDEPSEEDTQTANAPSSQKNPAAKATHKENSIKAASKPKNEAADAPGNRARAAASEAAESVDDDYDPDDPEAIEPERDEVPDEELPDSMTDTESITVRIRRQQRSLNVGGLNVLEALRRRSLEIGTEVTVPMSVADHLIDTGAAVALDGDEEMSRSDYMKQSRDERGRSAEEAEEAAEKQDAEKEDDEDEEEEQSRVASTAAQIIKAKETAKKSSKRSTQKSPKKKVRIKR